MYAPQTYFDSGNLIHSFFLSGKPEGADGEDMETSSHMDAQVLHFSLKLVSVCQIIVIKLFLSSSFCGGSKKVPH